MILCLKLTIILKNTIYKGKRKFKGSERTEEEAVFFNVKNIVSTELFNKCTDIRLSKTHRNYLTNHIYLLKDLMFCGCCGRNYMAKFKPVKGGDKVYICTSRLIKGGNCGNIGLNISLVESAIYNEIISNDSVLKHINDRDKIKKQLDETFLKLSNQVKINQNLLNECESNIEHLIQLSTYTKVKPSVFEKQYEKLETEQSNLELKLEKEQNELKKVTHALAKRTDKKHTSILIEEVKKDRLELRTIYKEIISKVIINKINTNTVLASVFLSIDGIEISSALKLYLDIQGVRKKEKRYSYIAVADLPSTLEFDNNQLITPLDKLQEELFILEDNSGMLDVDFVNIPSKNIIEIPIEKKYNK